MNAPFDSQSVQPSAPLMPAWTRLALLIGWLLIAANHLAYAQVAAPATKPTLKTGVFYFPGWKNGALGLGSERPWEAIKAYPERRPHLGWYDEGQEAIMSQQLKWMAQYGLDFIVFDAYWLGDEHQRPLMDHALQAYLKTQAKQGIQFALMYANHDGRPRRGQDFYALIAYWLEHYLTRPEYLKVNGKPVIFIMAGEDLNSKAQQFGSRAEWLFERAQTLARAAGLPELYFIAGTGANDPITHGSGKKMGYSAYFAYNYHAPPGVSQTSHSYTELDQAYRAHWDWFMHYSDLPYVIPTSVGWDSRPWGGSADRQHDKSTSTALQFQQHLASAKALLLRYPQQTLGLSVICCWNEYGEGSYIEPTAGTGFSYLEAIKTVFKTP